MNINERDYSQFLPLPADIELPEDKPALFELGWLSLLRVEGAGAADFLQGQLTADFRKLNADQGLTALFCNLQGRIEAMMQGVLLEEQIHLCLPADLLALTQQALHKAALFSRVKLAAATDYHCLGYYQPAGSESCLELPNEAPLMQFVTRADWSALHLGQGQWLLLLRQSPQEALIYQYNQTNQWRSALAWHLLCLRSQQFQIYPISRGLFLPHRLDLHLTGAISFDKGCYRGQEIIARMHYKTKAKYGLRQLELSAETALRAGANLLDPETGAVVGELVDYAPLSSQRVLALGSVLLDYQGEFRLG